MSNLFNICNLIQCPFSQKYGCSRYSVIGRCHLMADRPRLNGESDFQRSGIRNNQYWLFADADEPLVDINELRQRNEEFIANDESSQLRLKRQNTGRV